MNRNFSRFHWVAALFFAAAVLFPGVSQAEGRPEVFVSILPQKTFVEKIAGDRVAVSVMVKPGASPATYEPKPRQMAQLSRASAYFAIGVPFESVWLKKLASANPAMKIVHTERGIEKVPMAAHPHGHEARGEKDDHRTSGVLDPHIWTSPPLVMILARNIFTALIDLDPSHRAVYTENYKRFVRELAEFDAELIAIFSNRGRQDRFMVFHPSWGYFARAYGLTQVPIEIEGKSPKPAQLQALIAHAREHNVRVIFAQPQFSTESAELIAREIGGKVIFADPLALDWADNLRKQAEAFRSAME